MTRTRKRSYRTQVASVGFFVLLLAGSYAVPAVSQTAGSPQNALVEIFQAAQDLRQPEIVAGIPDFSAAAVERQKAGLAELRSRFDDLDPTGWPMSDQVDYLLVRAELDMLDYGLHVYRATSRSPAFYLSSISSFGMLSGAALSGLGRLVQQPPPFTEARAAEIVAHMESVPGILEQAKQNLTEPTREMSGWALATLADAQSGSRAFAEGLRPHFPAEWTGELDAAAVEMGAALESYRLWIEERLPGMAGARPIGQEMYDWILRRIWLLPFDAEDILRLGEQEYARFLAFTSFEESRNRDLPELAGAMTTAEYAQRTEEEAGAIRRFLEEKGALDIPDYVGPYRRTQMPDYIQAFSLWAGLSGYSTPGNGVVKYSVPEDHPYTQTYWESIMRVDPSTNIF
ncbi:MAG: DUF885 family protein, partial [Rhodospirillaceae bacterium]|nr:DUF885 family protein [Rhodospirillaceae bacterium]